MQSLLIFFLVLVYTSGDNVSYNNKRNKLLQDEFKMALGADLKLTDKENIVNECLMRHKNEEIDLAFENPKLFKMSHHYFSYRKSIRNSTVYKILEDMPKGAVIHVHDKAMLGPDYLMKITYMENLYVCFGEMLMMKFSITIPKDLCTGKWQLLKTARRFSANVTKFDEELRKHFTLVVDNLYVVYQSITKTWEAFKKYFITIAPLVTFRPVMEQYLYDALKRFREGNVMYIEIRSSFPDVYEIDGTVRGPEITAKIFSKTIRKFIIDYPDFVGAKFIYAPGRKTNVSNIENHLNMAKKVKAEIPEYFAGFDLVGQEDKGNPLIDFVPQLLAASKELDYFFHAGETNWYGFPTDENLVDAILLGAKRLGHAYALTKHPILMREVVNKDIGLEVNVISNTVLSLVHDIRNHPLSVLFSVNMPVVISSDDPGIWEADVLTDDFYVAFVGVASKHSDLRMLKQLAINSFKYSALEHTAKTEALRKFDGKWNEFVNNFNCSLY